MKILYTATIGGSMILFPSIIKELIEAGNTVDIAANGSESPVPEYYHKWGCKVFNLGWSRSPLSIGNIKTIFQLKKLIKKEKYDLVHCHTPIAGVCTRLACKKLRKDGLKVFYTAHGFHFYKGAPLGNWLVYYPVEKICSRLTDLLITINHEDYIFAQKHLMGARKIEYVSGIGVDIDRFNSVSVDRKALRKEIGIPEDAFLLVSVGELNSNKNHEIVIRAIASLNNPRIYYIIAGIGPLKEYLINLSKELKIDSKLKLLGFRNDAEKLYNISDVNVFPSVREGFGLAAVEGMASGIPLICSDNRGTREYAENNKNAFVCHSVSDYARSIKTFLDFPHIAEEMGRCGRKKSSEFSIRKSNDSILSFYGIKHN